MVKSHYIPQHYLRGFCNSEGKICCYDKSTLNTIHTYPDDVAYEIDFYPIELERELATTIENKGARLLQNLKDGKMITESEKIIIAKYITNFIKRTPTGWLKLNKHRNAIIKKVSDEVEQEMIAQIRANPSQRDRLEKRWIMFKSVVEEYKEEFPRDFWYPSLRPKTSKNVVETISKMVWEFYVADKPVFITSDNPVSYPESLGISNHKAIVTFAISSTLILQATKLITKGMQFYQARQSLIDLVNQRTLQGANRYIFYSQEVNWQTKNNPY